MGLELNHYVREFERLRVNLVDGRPSPHKAVMLLSLIQLFDEGKVQNNRIEFSPELKEVYRAFFEVVANERDHAHPYFPFFHLQGADQNSRFWHLTAKVGRERELASLRSPRRLNDIHENVAYVSLDPELYQHLQDPESRRVLQLALLRKWFPEQMQVLLTVAGREKGIAEYADVLRETVEAGLPTVPENLEAVPPVTRDPAFCRVVREAYDYRCAATGWRVILPDGRPMVEAAHLIPFGTSHDDDPRNGIAVSPTYHWALDSCIIAPGPDLRWHVAKIFDRRNRDYADLLQLDGTQILLPANKKYWPRRDGLVWRMDHLLPS
jgi:putative restriction endonuclease